jgi:hypothetical protein
MKKPEIKRAMKDGAASFSARIREHPKSYVGGFFLIGMAIFATVIFAMNYNAGQKANAPFQVPIIKDGNKVLSDANMYAYLGGVRNDTGAFVLRYEGAVNGIIPLYLAPAAGAAYSFTYMYMWYWGSDSGLISSGGVWNDGQTRTFKPMGGILPVYGQTTFNAYEYRTVATAKATYTAVNNTIATISVANPCKSKPVTPVGNEATWASNLTLDIQMSQVYADRNCAFASYNDAVNATAAGLATDIVGVYIGLLTNGSSTSVAASYMHVSINGQTLSAITNVGTANYVYYLLPITLTATAPVQVLVQWNAASAAAAAVCAIQATTVYYAAASAPQTALYTL